FQMVTVALCLGGVSLFAQGGQQSAQVSGQVADPQGKTIADAAVHIAKTDGSLQRDTKTDSSGLYSFTDVPAGEYRIVTEAEGFDTKTSDPVNLTAGQSLAFNVQLTAVKGTTTNIEVQGGGSAAIE